jgi:hypothetical protein
MTTETSETAIGARTRIIPSKTIAISKDTPGDGEPGRVIGSPSKPDHFTAEEGVLK